ncbi:hypothetical protein EUGRSUZ_F03994 [Eucalyptus grandis]|uniref:Uncharacterized protein n=2 Tax=Eucalyptus grandis TaxID=71139 RepID=A0ACC3KNB7_EUCGR|nr:hypothetical protein EUGRSUZ_F03994 [Eucalyptus grandis]
MKTSKHGCWTYEARGRCADLRIPGRAGDVGDAEEVGNGAGGQPSQAQGAPAFLEGSRVVEPQRACIPSRR